MRGFFEEAFNPTWPLAEVLDWRRDYEPDLSLQEAFEELRQIGLSGQVHASGFSCNVLWSKQPWRPLPWKPFVELPRDERIPAGEWEDLYPVVDHEGRPTGALNFISVRLLAWTKVWLGQTDLIRAWVPIIEARKSSRLVPSDKTAMPDGAGGVYRTGLSGKPTSARTAARSPGGPARRDDPVGADMLLSRCLSLADAVNRVAAVAYGDSWVKIIDSNYAALQWIRASAWLKSHGFNTAAGARIDRKRFEKVLAQDPPNKDGDWVVVERRAPDFAVDEEHTVFEWCMIYTAKQPNTVPIYNGTTVENMNGRLRMIGALPATDFTHLLVRRKEKRQDSQLPNKGFGAAPASVKKHPDSQVRNEVFRTIEADIRADRIIPLKLAYCSDQPERFDPTMCVIGITPVLALARRRRDYGQTMAELLVAHSGASSERTGAAGRPSNMHLIEAEFRRRVGDAALEPTLREEATALCSWHRWEHPKKPPPTIKTIENRLRGPYRQAVNNKRSEEA